MANCANNELSMVTMYYTKKCQHFSDMSQSYLGVLLACLQMLRLTAGRAGSLLARRATAAVTTSGARMSSHGQGATTLHCFTHAPFLSNTHVHHVGESVVTRETLTERAGFIRISP